MIIQAIPENAPATSPHFVIKNVEHTALAAQLAEAFGNDNFRALEPREEMLFLIRYHDQGWEELDNHPPLNPEDGLPLNLTQMPLNRALETCRGSPDFNEKRSPLCGMLSSMHSYGLHAGRYGLAYTTLTLDSISDDVRPLIEAMLDGELARQARLRPALAGSE